MPTAVPCASIVVVIGTAILAVADAEVVSGATDVFLPRHAHIVGSPPGHVFLPAVGQRRNSDSADRAEAQQLSMIAAHFPDGDGVTASQGDRVGCRYVVLRHIGWVCNFLTGTMKSMNGSFRERWSTTRSGQRPDCSGRPTERAWAPDCSRSSCPSWLKDHIQGIPGRCLSPCAAGLNDSSIDGPLLVPETSVPTQDDEEPLAGC